MQTISFVIPCYRSEHTIECVVNEINKTMSNNKDYTYEIVLVNDSSPDETYQVIMNLSKQYENIIGVNLARNFGQHAALMAGFHYVSGDIIVCLDDDGQTPADEVFKLINKVNEGYDVVYASYGNKKHSIFRNFGSKLNSKMTEMLLDKPQKLNITSYFVARRFIIEQVIKYQNPYPYVIGLVLRSSNKITNVEVLHRARSTGKSGYTLKKLLSLWLNGFTAFSVKPLRIATLFGSLFAFLGFLYAIYIVINKFINPNVPAGWSSIISVLMVIGGIIMCMLGLIGEYIGRIYISINKSPQFVVREITRDDKADKE